VCISSQVDAETLNRAGIEEHMDGWIVYLLGQDNIQSLPSSPFSFVRLQKGGWKPVLLFLFGLIIVAMLRRYVVAMRRPRSSPLAGFSQSSQQLIRIAPALHTVAWLIPSGCGDSKEEIRDTWIVVSRSHSLPAHPSPWSRSTYEARF